MTHCLDDFVYELREDVAEESVPIEDLLRNSDETEDREIVVPKVVG
jgi:Asp-tRNA(Asn)/Glu-tRNA(Gln) amidotransferase C subunit